MGAGTHLAKMRLRGRDRLLRRSVSAYVWHWRSMLLLQVMALWGPASFWSSQHLRASRPSQPASSLHDASLGTSHVVVVLGVRQLLQSQHLQPSLRSSMPSGTRCCVQKGTAASTVLSCRALAAAAAPTPCAVLQRDSLLQAQRLNCRAGAASSAPAPAVNLREGAQWRAELRWSAPWCGHLRRQSLVGHASAVTGSTARSRGSALYRSPSRQKPRRRGGMLSWAMSTLTLL